MRRRAHRSIRRSFLSLLFVGVVAFAHVAAQLGAALAAPITIECCCGEHAADVDCGCPDCLGAVYRSEAAADRDGDHGDAVRPCGQEGPRGAISAAPIPWSLPAAADDPPAVPARAADPPPAGAMPPSADVTWSRAPS